MRGGRRLRERARCRDASKQPFVSQRFFYKIEAKIGVVRNLKSPPAGRGRLSVLSLYRASQGCGARPFSHTRALPGLRRTPSTTRAFSTSAKMLRVTVSGWSSCQYYQRARAALRGVEVLQPGLRVEDVEHADKPAFLEWWGAMKPRFSNPRAEAHKSSPVVWMNENDVRAAARPRGGGG